MLGSESAASRSVIARCAAGVSAAFRVADAGDLPIGAGTLDAVATNPPWGLRVTAAGTLRGGFDRFWAELARVLADEGRAVVLLPGATRVPGQTGLEIVGRTAVGSPGGWGTWWCSSAVTPEQRGERV